MLKMMVNMLTSNNSGKNRVNGKKWTVLTKTALNFPWGKGLALELGYIGAIGETQLISGVDLQMGKWTDVKTETAEHFL